jgi:hypothetical protein
MQLGAYEQAKSLGENFADKSKGHEIIELAFDWVQDYRERNICRRIRFLCQGFVIRSVI